VDDGEITILGAGPKEIRVKPGAHRIRATRDGKALPVDQELVTVTRGGRQIVRIRRENSQQVPGKLAATPVHGLPGFVHVATLDGYTGHVMIWSLAFAPDGKTLVSTSGELGVFSRPRPGDTGFPERRAPSKEYPGEIRLWDLAANKVLWSAKDPSGVKVAAFSPGTTTLATGDIDGTLRLRNADGGDLIKILRAGTGPVNAVAFAPDGQTLAAGNSDLKVRIVRVGTREVLERFESGNSQSVLCLAYSPDGKTLAVGGADQPQLVPRVEDPDGNISKDEKADISTVRLFEVGSWKARAVLAGHHGAVTSLAFSPDGKLLATAGADHTIKLWNVADGKEVATLKGHTARVNAVAFSPDGTLLVSAGHDKTVKLWDVVRRKLFLSSPQESVVHSMALSPNGKTLAVGFGLTIKLWNISSVYAQAPLRQRLATLREIAARSEGAYKEGAASLGAVRQASLAVLSAELDLCETPRERIAVSEKILAHRREIEKSLEAAYKESAATEDVLLRARTERQEAEIALQRERARVTPPHLSPRPLDKGAPPPVDKSSSLEDKDTPLLADKGTIPLVDKARHALETLTKAAEVYFLDHQGTWPPNLDVLFTKDKRGRGPYLLNEAKLIDPWGKRYRYNAAGPEHGGARPDIWTEIPQGKIGNWQAEQAHIDTLKKRFEHEMFIKANTIPPLREIATLREHEGAIWSIAFAPDGKTLVSAGGGAGKLTNVEPTGEIKLWDIAARKELWSAKSPSIISAVAFSPGGTTLAAAEADGTVRLREASSGWGLEILRGHDGPVYTVAFAPNGQTLASSGSDHVVRIWRIGTKQLLESFDSGYTELVKCLAFSRDGKTLAVAGLDQREPKGQVIKDADGTIHHYKRGARTVRLVEVGSWKVRAVLSGHDGYVEHLAFSPDGKVLATCGLYGGGRDVILAGRAAVRLWNVDNGKEAGALIGHMGTVRCVAFSPDSALLASAAGDQIYLWDVARRKKLTPLRGHKGQVSSIAFSPDGKTLASAGADRAIKLWDIAAVYTMAKMLSVREEHLATLREIEAQTEKLHKAGSASAGALLKARLAVLDAELTLCESPGEQFKVREKILAHRQEIEKQMVELHKVGAAAQDTLLRARMKRQEAEIELERLKAKVPGTVVPVKTSAAKIVNTLSILMGGRYVPALDAQPEGNAIAIRADAETAAEIRELIQQLDVPPSADGSDYTKLQGTWKVKRLEFFGQARPYEAGALKDLRWTFFARDKILITRKSALWGIVRLDETKNPKEINIDFPNAPGKVRPYAGIYQLEGNRLKLCWTDQPNGTRPRDFQTGQGDNVTLAVLERTQP
jgi:uncharacterized protein (TIGR03067 family)